MTTKAPPTTRTSQSCKCARRGRKSRSKLRSLDICESCAKEGRMGQSTVSRSLALPDKKRKREVRSTISDSESSDRNDRKSVGTLSHFSQDLLSVGSGQRETRSLTRSLSKLFEPTQVTGYEDQKKSKDFCGICTGRSDRKSWRNLLKEDPEIWIRCDFQTCSTWHHLSCILVLIRENTQRLLFAPTPRQNFVYFICPRCLDQPKNGDKSLPQGIEALLRTFEKKNSQTTFKEEPMVADCVIDKTPPDLPKVIEEAKEDLVSIDDTTMEFESAREEKYNGFDTAIVNGLIRNLHQYIYDYDMEIRSVLDRFTNISEVWTQYPLKEWKVIDVDECVAAGQPWFHMDDREGNQSSSYAPLTAALRSMLGTSEGEALEIPSKLKNLTFSQVHIGLISWFVFDVLENHIDLYGLPKMREMNAMMTAVLSAGEARWPTKGRHLLREVRLRTWHKSEFRKSLLSNRDMFSLILESFLEPFTKDLDGIQLSSEGLSNIIDVVLPLWAYLQSLHGKLIMIEPAIGSNFDANIHEVYDQHGMQQDPKKISNKKILWILCRGFRFEEEGLEDVRVLTVKARVVL